MGTIHKEEEEEWGVFIVYRTIGGQVDKFIRRPCSSSGLIVVLCFEMLSKVVENEGEGEKTKSNQSFLLKFMSI